MSHVYHITFHKLAINTVKKPGLIFQLQHCFNNVRYLTLCRLERTVYEKRLSTSESLTVSTNITSTASTSDYIRQSEPQLKNIKEPELKYRR